MLKKVDKSFENIFYYYLVLCILQYRQFIISEGGQGFGYRFGFDLVFNVGVVDFDLEVDGAVFQDIGIVYIIFQV